MTKHRRRKGGRKRKLDAKRYPCGLLVPDTIKPTPEALKHRVRHVGTEKALRPEAGYALGILLLKGRLTRRQHDAGYEFQLVHKRWCILNGIPPRHPLCLSDVRASRTPLPSEEEERQKDVAKERLAGAMEIIARAGVGVYAAVDAVVIDGSLPDHLRQLKDLVEGLEVLAGYFRIPQSSD